MKVTIEINSRACLRWLLALFFLWAAVSKLANPTEFLASLYAYQLPFPRFALQLAAVLLPWLELLCGLLLLVDVWSESTLAVALALMLVFLAATGQAWLRGLDISCGCFNLRILGLHSPDSNFVKLFESVGFAFFRNLVLSAVAGNLFWRKLADLREPPAIESAPSSETATGRIDVGKLNPSTK